MDLKESIKENKFLILIAIIVGIACLYQSGGLHFLFQNYQLKEPRLWMCCGYYHSQYDGSNKWWESNNIIQEKCDAKILGYDIHLSKADYYVDSESYVQRRCLYKATIRKDNEIVWASIPDVPSNARTNADYTICRGGGGTGEVEGLRFAFGQVWRYAYSSCKRVNSYFWIKIPEDKINISVSANKIITVNEVKKAHVKIANNWDQNLKAEIKAKICTPTIIGESCKDYNFGIFDIPSYSNEKVELIVPTQTIGDITITPIVYFMMSSTGIENLNYGSSESSSLPITEINYLDLGYIEGDSYEIKIVDKICEDGEIKCEDFDFYTCENNDWVNKGKLIGRCNVECFSNNDCLLTEPFLMGECLNHICVVILKDIGDTCTVDEECKSGNCLEGNCRFNSWKCVTDISCEEGDYCTEDNICKEKTIIMRIQDFFSNIIDWFRNIFS